jgi:lysophospholipase L1-like esterase
MTRRAATSALLAALLFTSLISTGVSAAPTTLPLPDTMAAVGDSITQAASTGGSLGADYPQNSWSTGTNSAVNSHYLRLLALGAPISGQNYNGSVSGAKAAGLDAQMLTLDGLNPEYLTVQIGGNDVCTDTVAQMTSVDDFRAQFATAMATLARVSPDTYVYVVSIPDAYQLWSLFKNNWWARFIWSAGGVCQSLLANPTSTQQVDVLRRQDVQGRNIAFNTQLEQVCESIDFVAHCLFDNNAVFNTKFTTGDVAGDYFHPSIAGQAKLAAVTWAAGYAWAAGPPPVSQDMRVGSLVGTPAKSGRTAWTATVTIGVLDTGTTPVAGVTVTGTWSAGSGATTCTTGSAGTCSVKSSTLSRTSTPSVNFTVGGLTRTGWAYRPDLNAVTSVSVSRP